MDYDDNKNELKNSQENPPHPAPPPESSQQPMIMPEVHPQPIDPPEANQQPIREPEASTQTVHHPEPGPEAVSFQEFQMQPTSPPSPDADYHTGAQPVQPGKQAPPVSSVEPKNHMALASMVMGILSIVTSCCCCGGLIFGSLGLLFALLSKTDGKMDSQAKTGLITSIVGLCLVALAVLVWLFFAAIGALGSASSDIFDTASVMFTLI